MSSRFDAERSRRAVLQGGLALGLVAALAGVPALAAESLAPILRTVPSTGEKLPVVGIGTNAFDVTAADEIATRKEVLKNLPLLGGKIVDTARAYGRSEEVIGQLVEEIGNRDKLFFSTKTPLAGGLANPRAIVEEAFKRLRTDRIDLYEIHNFYGMEELLPVLREYKQAKKIRYIGATTSFEPQHALLVEAIRKHSLDFIQVNYSIEDRSSAKDVLPAAQEKGVAVLINMPLGGRRGSFMPKLANKPLPDWAAEVDATSWAQLLLKYNLSHPAVTAVIPGTTIMPYLEDNQRAGRGRLPDAALRKRIEDLWAAM
jgi:aryl-alcohol dehydrogenase-like predicted oxidoreductase